MPKPRWPAAGTSTRSSPWPGHIRTVYGDHQRVIDTYYATYPGFYFTGDGARRDAEGYYWITGRVDDVMNISGHRLGTAEVESALVLHPDVAEAAVVGFPHEIKGEGIYAFVTPTTGTMERDGLVDELIEQVRSEIGPIAKPDVIQLAPGLPKTRSGKIMRSHPAQDRRRRSPRPRGHIDAGRPRRGRRPRVEPRMTGRKHDSPKTAERETLMSHPAYSSATKALITSMTDSAIKSWTSSSLYSVP